MKRAAARALLRWIAVLASLVGGLALAGAVAMRWLRPEVTVTRVVEAPVVQAFYATGTLLPVREYSIKSNNAGVITAVMVDKGDLTTKEQPLAIVEEDAVRFRYEQAVAERDLKASYAVEETSPVLKEFDAKLAAADQLLELARREQHRVSEMLEKSASSQADLDRAIDRVKTIWSQVESLKAQRAAKKLELARDLEVAEAALRIARWNLDRQTVRSPIDRGSVLDRPLSVGTRVAVNDHLMQVADVRPDRLVMRAAVDEEDKTFVSLGQSVRMVLYAFPDRVFEGKVDRIYDKADLDRRTFEIDVVPVEKSPAFSAGMTGELAFIIEQKAQALVIPSQAVQAGDVWVVRDGQLARVDAKLGLKSIERTEVTTGLKQGELVVISPVQGLKLGQPVRLRELEPAEAAGLNRPRATDNFRGFR